MIQRLGAPRPLILTRTSEIIVARRAVEDYYGPKDELSQRLDRSVRDRDWKGTTTPLFTVEESALIIEALHAKQCRETNTPGEEWEQAAAAHVLAHHEPLRGTEIYELAVATLSHIAIEGA